MRYFLLSKNDFHFSRSIGHLQGTSGLSKIVFSQILLNLTLLDVEFDADSKYVIPFQKYCGQKIGLSPLVVCTMCYTVIAPAKQKSSITRKESFLNGIMNFSFYTSFCWANQKTGHNY